MAGALARRVGRRQAGVLAVVTGASAVLLGLTASGVLASVGAPASRPAAGIMPATLPTGTEPGPAAAVGDQGAIYVFWKDPSGQLWEIQSTAWAKKWGTAHKIIGADQLGSAPAVTVLPDSSYGLPGPYVIWAQARTHKLMYAFQDHGQWESLPFADGAVATSAPTAIPVNIAANTYLDAFWRNASGDLEEASCLNGGLCDSAAPQEVTAGGHAMGPMGSAPAVGVSSYGIDVFWRGMGAHHLWLAYTKFQAKGIHAGQWHSPILVRDTSGHPMGPMASGPAVAPQVNYIWWQNASKGLEETKLDPKAGPDRFDNPGTFSPQRQPTLHVRIASPLAVVGGLELFWKGSDRYLWFAYHSVRWYGPFKLHAGPIG